MDWFRYWDVAMNTADKNVIGLIFIHSSICLMGNNKTIETTQDLELGYLKLDSVVYKAEFFLLCFAL